MLRDQLEKALEDAKALRVGIKRKYVEVMAAEERVREVEGEIRGLGMGVWEGKGSEMRSMRMRRVRAMRMMLMRVGVKG